MKHKQNTGWKSRWGRDYFGDFGINGRIILNMIFGKMDERTSTASFRKHRDMKTRISYLENS
jgi:hypothetical protein